MKRLGVLGRSPARPHAVPSALSGALPEPLPGRLRTALPALLPVVLGLAELAIIGWWTADVARPWLNFDPVVSPSGREFLHHIHPNSLWVRLKECGACALWNGSVRGGYPALADPQGSALHPLVALTTLLWGVLNGAKVALALTLFMSGAAQWWLARTLGAGRVASIWAAGIGVAGTHLAGRMEHGIYGLALSTAAYALALPPLLWLLRTASLRAAVWLGVTLGLLAVAGQGYLQIGAALALPPVMLVGALTGPAGFWRYAQRYALAAALAMLLAAPFLVPVARFWPELTKFSDPAYGSVQPLPYVPLNLVVNDFTFYLNDALHKLPFAWLYAYYVGWIPVLLAGVGLGAAVARREDGALSLALLAGIGLLLAAGMPFIWLKPGFLGLSKDAIERISIIRYPPVMLGLAVPPLLGLSALGADWVWRLPWPRLGLPRGGRGVPAWLALDARWVLLLPLLFSWGEARTFARNFIATIRLDQTLFQTLEVLKTPDAQWVDTPLGEQFWIEPSTRAGLKLSRGTQGWFWFGRVPPEPVLEGTRGQAPPGREVRSNLGGVVLVAHPPGREYAAVAEAGGGRVACSARSAGGNIDVTCDSRGGVLTVKENVWGGWSATVDGKAMPLGGGPWLALEVSPGRHTVALRYRPWDVVVGLALSALGVALSVWLLTLKNEAARRS